MTLVNKFTKINLEIDRPIYFSKEVIIVRIRKGNNSWGDVVYTIDGDKIRAGNHSWGDVVYTIDGDKIRAGNHSWGDVLYTIER